MSTGGPPRSRYRFSQQDRDQAVARYLAGESPTVICRDLDMSRAALRRYVLAAGHSMRQPGSSPSKSATGICLRCDQPFTYQFRTGRRSVCDACHDRRRAPAGKHPARACPDCGQTMTRSMTAARCLTCQRKRQREQRAATRTGKPEPRTAVCHRCGADFTYVKPPGRGGVRRNCDDCARERKRDWEQRRAEPLRAAYGLGPRPCDQCGSTFQPATSTHRYCTRACGEAARRERRRDGAVTPLGRRTCDQCGQGYTQTNGRQRFCSDACRYLAFKSGRYAATAYAFTYAGTTVHLTASRVAQMRRDFGLAPDQYEAMWKRQRGKCAICRQPLKDKPHPHIDHDPRTMKVRGLLCVSCNMALGYLKDDPRTIDRAAAYLRQQ